jgi:hypothetical protein
MTDGIFCQDDVIPLRGVMLSSGRAIARGSNLAKLMAEMLPFAHSSSELIFW